MSHISVLYGTAQTDTAVISVASNQRLTIRRIQVCCDNANSVDVGMTLGFGVGVMTSTFAGHPGIAAGSGFVEVYPEGVVEGGLGERLLFTCETPTGGGIRVSCSYILHTFTAPS